MRAIESIYNDLFKKRKNSLFKVMKKAEGTEIGPDEFAAKIDMAATQLSRILTPEEKKGYVAIRMTNGTSYFVILFALIRIGCSPLLIDVRSGKDQCESLLRDAGGTVVLTDVPFPEESFLHVVKINDVLEECTVDYEVTWAEYMAFSTSGTSGASKVIAYDVDSIATHVVNVSGYCIKSKFMRPVFGEDLAMGKSCVTVLPMNHILGFIIVLAVLRLGFFVVFPRNEAVSTLFETIRSEKISGILGVPMIWQTIFNVVSSKTGEFTKQSLAMVLGENFKFGLSGGTNMIPELREAYYNAEFLMISGYGATEIGFVSIADHFEHDIYSEGSLYKCFDGSIRDSKGNESEEGELFVKCLQFEMFMRGFLRNGELVPIETDKDGFFATGDIFRIEKEQLYFVGRRKNIIVNDSGENIYIEELEGKMNTLINAGLFFSIFGRDNEPYLLVRIQNPEDVEKVREGLAADIGALRVYERPVKAVFTACELPITGKGELKKYLLTDEILNHKDNIEIIFKKGKNEK